MEKIETLLEEVKLLLQQNKSVLNANEACVFLGVSKNYFYRLTANGKVKYYRPFGKLMYFERDELLNVLKHNGVNSQVEISKKATNYLLTAKSSKSWKK